MKKDILVADLRPMAFMENIVGIYKSLDAAFSANNSHTLEVGVGKSYKSAKCSMQRCTKDKRYETPDKGGVEYNSAGKVDLLRPISEKQVGASQESGNGQMDMNQVVQTSLSPPSYGNTKGSDVDSDHVSLYLA